MSDLDTEIELAKRHDELVSVLQTIANKDFPAVNECLTALTAIARKDVTPDMRPLVTALVSGMKEMAQMINKKPTTYTVVRDADGFIKQITAK